MTPSKPGDVVFLPFPFTDLTTVKQRPAVVISSEAFNARQQDVMVLAITSQIPSMLGPEDYRLSHVVKGDGAVVFGDEGHRGMAVMKIIKTPKNTEGQVLSTWPSCNPDSPLS